MRYRFTLHNLLIVPPFSQWEAESGSWSISDTPSVTIASPTNASIVIDYPLIPGSYELEYDITVAGTGVWFLNFRFEKDGGSTLLSELSTGGSSPGTLTDTIPFTLTDTSTSIQIQFVNFSGANKTLTINSTEITMDAVQISEPDGWKDAKLVMERDPNFFSLIERYDGAANGGFVFYGDNGEEDGGVNFLKDVEVNYGFDENIELLAELSFDDINYQEVFNGLVDLSEKNEMTDNKIQAPVIRDDFWARFINRMDTPVNVTGTEDLDGNSVGAVTATDVELTSQTLRQTFRRTTGYNANNEGTFTNDNQTVGTTAYLIFDNGRHDLDEITERFEYGTQVSAELPTDVKKYIFLTEYAGDYEFDFSVRYALVFGASVNVSVSWWLAYKVNDVLTTTQIGTTTSGTGVTTHKDGTPRTLNTTVTLPQSAEVYVYGIVTLNLNTSITYFPDYDNDTGAPFDDVYTAMEVIADTTFPATTVQGYMLDDLISGVLNRMGLPSNALSSDFFTSGCGADFMAIKGLQIRNYTLSEKPFFISFKQLWDGLNPIFNLGLGYETVASVQKIRIEEKEHFLDDTPVINFSNVRDIGSGYDGDLIFKTIKTGYKKWESEDASGIDDPQTKHTYATRFIKTGKDITIESEFIAASLAFENARRKTRKKSTDYKHDNDTFILALNTGTTPYTPELMENFNGVTNLINEDTRYNLILTPKRNLLRWSKYFLGGLQSYLTSSIRFVSGEGNYAMGSSYDCTSGLECLAIICMTTINENSNIDLSTYGASLGYYFLPMEYEISIPMEWEEYETIRSNPKKAIGISQTDENHEPFFIKELEYDIISGQANIKAWPKTFFTIQIINEYNMSACD